MSVQLVLKCEQCDERYPINLDALGVLSDVEAPIRRARLNAADHEGWVYEAGFDWCHPDCRVRWKRANRGGTT